MVTTMQGKSCLVLNKGWTPLRTVTLRRAMTLVCSEYEDTGLPKAKIIDHASYQTFTWSDWSNLRLTATDEVIQSARLSFKVPEIIILTSYEQLPRAKSQFSRRTIYKRDKLTCQYCGKRPGSEELTIDHVIPRSQGGTSTWENTTLACVACNSRKANRTPEQAGMKLLSIPKKPDMDLFNFGMCKPVKSWTQFVSCAYWLTELENDNEPDEDEDSDLD